jgi:hypothetical protein
VLHPGDACDRHQCPVNQRVKTLVHELSHALLCLEREETDLPFGYCEEELVVESIVSAPVAIDSGSGVGLTVGDGRYPRAFPPGARPCAVSDQARS